MIGMLRHWGEINQNVLYACIKLSNNRINIVLEVIHKNNKGTLMFLYTQ